MEKSTITIQSTSHNEIFRGQISMEFYKIEQFKSNSDILNYIAQFLQSQNST